MTEIFEIENNEVSQDAMPLLLAENAEDASGPPTSHLPHLIHDEEAEADAELERDTEQEDAGAPVTPSEAVSPNREWAEEYARIVFGGMAGYVNLRAIEEPEPQGRSKQVEPSWVPIDENLPKVIGNYVVDCASRGLAAFLVPAPVNNSGSGITDLKSARFLVADFDNNSPEDNLAALVAVVGPATMVLASGGVDKSSGQKKLHVYYRIAGDVTPDEFPTLNRARLALAAFGADKKVAGNPAQLLRVSGSVHLKDAPASVKRLSVTDTSYSLAHIVKALNLTAPQSAIASDGYNHDYSSDRAPASVDRVLTQTIQAEGKSEDGLTRFEGAGQALGHFIRMAREGRYSLDEAWSAAKDWNAATLVPPWPEDRLRGDWDRLVKRELEARGPITPPAKHGPLKIKDWSMRRYEGAPPAQRWLVEGTFPLGEPGILAGDGGVGKSFLALDLCLRIATGKAVPPGALDFGRTEIFGGSVVEFGSAVFITAEESKEALHRRLAELDPHNTRHQKPDNLFVVSLRDRSGPRTLIKSQRENYAISDFARELAAELKSEFKDLRLVVLDPVSALFGDNLNDRAAVQALADVLSWIASETGATVIGLHHRRKDGDDGRKSILGSSGFVDAFRFAYILQLADKKEASKYAPEFGLSDEHGEIVVGELVKANGGPKGGEHIYERQPSGVLRQLPSRVDLAMSTREARLVLLVEAVDWYAEYGQPFTKTSRAGGSGVTEHRACLPPELRELSGRELQALVDEAVKRKELVTAAAGGEKRQQWLCRPGSNVAMGNLRAFTPGARPPWETRIAA